MGIAFPETLLCMCSVLLEESDCEICAFSVQVSYLTWSGLPGVIGGDLNKPASFRFQRLVFKSMLRRACGYEYGVQISISVPLGSPGMS